MLSGRVQSCSSIFIASYLPYTHLQIWVSSPHNGSGYYGLKDEINDALSKEHFHATLSGAGDTTVRYARTGYLGFMMKSEKTDRTGG